MTDEVWYLALRKLKIPNGPGQIPSSARIERGEPFVFDGDEPVDVAALIRQGAIRLYVGDEEDKAFIETQTNERIAEAKRPRLRRK